ncbi:MAG: prephenate dehydrogenase/arogenate dehydrogenase family protein [Bacteroidia bacterium]
MKILILGINGGFGRLFYSLLSRENHSITGVDLQPSAESGITPQKYISCNLFSPDEQVVAEASQADMILICLPEKVVYPLLPLLLPHTRRDSLTVETTSVKSIITDILSGIPVAGEVLSINPMFSPDLGMDGNNMVAVKFQPGKFTEWFARFTQKHGCRITWMTTRQHDMLTAVTQVATHAAIISFGFMLEKMDYQVDTNLPVSTPPHLNLLALFSRIQSANPEVYWKIQTDNPYGQMARETLLESMKSFVEMVESNDIQLFSEKMKTALPGEKSYPEKLAEECREIFSSRFKGLK